MKALVIGHSAYDVSCLIDAFPIENTKNEYNNIVESIGGGAVNMAYVLGKYGVETYIGSTVGDDTYGNTVKKTLEGIGVHTEYMETAYEKKTSLSFILVNQAGKTRTVHSITKEKLFLKKTEFQMDPDLIITDGSDYGASLSALNRYNNKITLIDAGKLEQETFELCKYCKYIVASKEFAEWVTGQKINFDNPQSLVSVYSAMLNKFPKKTIVITLENHGAMYMAENQIKVMPGLNVEAIDTTGAGDIFHAAFGYALLLNYDMEKAVTFANIAAGLSITKVGVQYSVAELSDIMLYFNQKYPQTAAAPNTETPSAMPNNPPQAQQ